MRYISVFVAMGVIMIVLGVVGYTVERRKRGPEGVRGFLIWYGLAWPFAISSIVAGLYPRLRWLYAVTFAIVAISYAVQILNWRRARARALESQNADTP